MTRKAMSELTLRNEALALVSERRPARTQLHVRVCGVCPTANCIIIDHVSAFESGLVAPFLYAA